MKIVMLNLGVEDDFVPGNCCDCPLLAYNHIEEYCILRRRYDECPLMLVHPPAGYDESDEGWDEIPD